MNDANDAIERWLQANAKPPAQIELGLTRPREVWRRMGVALAMPLIIVAGTNGKGSVCRMLSAMLSAAGFRVGCYTSPHLLRFGERISIDDAEASPQTILAALKAVKAAAGGKADAEADAKPAIELTYFELTTLAAARCMADSCDIAVLEVGLGGRLDAVNIFDAEVAVVTNIGLDHTEYLGDTRDLIGAEKAGICRPDKPVVIGDSDPPRGLLDAVASIGARPILIGRDFSHSAERHWNYRGIAHQIANLPPPALPGAHQYKNAATALAALECLPPALWVGASSARRGLHAVELPGRAQVLPGLPAVVLDVAHNTHAASALERQLFDMGYYAKTLAVLGMAARKDIAGFVGALNRRVDCWYVAQPQGGDASADEIAGAVAATGAAVKKCASIAQAAAAARADCGDNGRIIITGSFLTVADYMKNALNG